MCRFCVKIAVHRQLTVSPSRPYPVRRALPLVEAISRDLTSQLLKVLGSHRLTYMDYASFERAMSLAQAVFEAWDDSVKEFTNVAREVTRKRSERFMPIKINPDHAKLQERVSYLRGFRKQHHQLQVMVGPLGNETRRIGDGTERTVGVADIDMDAEVRAVSNFPPQLFRMLIRCFLRSVKRTRASRMSTSSTSRPVRFSRTSPPSNQ